MGELTLEITAKITCWDYFCIARAVVEETALKIGINLNRVEKDFEDHVEKLGKLLASDSNAELTSLHYEGDYVIEMDEKTLQRYRIYLGVKDVKLVVRPYKSRTAFTNLSSPPTIYLNEHLIDDEEIVEYLILRELIHIRLHMYR